MRKCFAFLVLAALPLTAGGAGKMNDAERDYLLGQLAQSKKAMAQQSLKSPAVERPATSNLDYYKGFAAKVQDRSQKAKAPEPLVPSQRFATPDDAAREFYIKDSKDHTYQFLVLLAAHSAQIREVPANAGHPKSDKGKFLAVYELAHGTPDQLTPAQRAILQQHAAYVKSLVEKGVITWAGHTDNPTQPHGYAELTATETEAKTYIDNDPAVKAGIFKCTVESFTEVLH